jgi:hypothetical protein
MRAAKYYYLKVVLLHTWALGLECGFPQRAKNAARTARNRDHPATSAKTRILQLRFRQIDHRL